MAFEVSDTLLQLAQEAVAKLRAKQTVVCTAESCTGGLIAHCFTLIPGASDVYWGGVVAYDNAAKAGLLGVAPELLERVGAVAAETAEAMAAGARRHPLLAGKALCIGLSTTGIAGPAGGSAAKPVGLCYLGLVSNERTTSRKLQNPENWDRSQNIAFFAGEALRLLIETL